MDGKAFEQFLNEKYKVELDQARQRTIYHQKWAKRSDGILIVLSATTTILLAISVFLKNLPITPISAICSALVTVIATTMRSLKTREKWSFYQKLSNDLDKEHYLYKAKDGSYQKVTDKEALLLNDLLLH